MENYNTERYMNENDNMLNEEFDSTFIQLRENNDKTINGYVQISENKLASFFSLYNNLLIKYKGSIITIDYLNHNNFILKKKIERKQKKNRKYYLLSFKYKKYKALHKYNNTEHNKIIQDIFSFETQREIYKYILILLSFTLITNTICYMLKAI